MKESLIGILALLGGVTFLSVSSFILYIIWSEFKIKLKTQYNILLSRKVDHSLWGIHYLLSQGKKEEVMEFISRKTNVNCSGYHSNKSYEADKILKEIRKSK